MQKLRAIASRNIYIACWKNSVWNTKAAALA
jgi:hypothetical protein